MPNEIVAAYQGDALATIEGQLSMDPRLQSRHTRRAYLGDLRTFEIWRAGRPLTKMLVQGYAAYLQQRERSPNSINRMLASVRWWARRLGDLVYESPMPKDQREEITLQAARVTGVQDVTGEREQKGRHLGADELQALLTVCRADPSAIGARDAAIFIVAWSTGMRRSEIAGLRLEDRKCQQAGQPYEVRGKGNKRRYAYLTPAAEGWLNAWLEVRGVAPGPLFCRIRKAGHLQLGDQMTTEGLAWILTHRLRQAGLAEHMTWHDFRRTFAGNLLDVSVDLATVQRLMGHSSPVTTSNYDRRGEATKIKAIGTISVPSWSMNSIEPAGPGVLAQQPGQSLE